MTSPQDTVILGRRAGQTTTPDWIKLVKISSQARDVYGILRMHMETFVGSGEDPFPAQELIAAIVGCSQSAVSRYVKELVGVGAVETTRRKVPGGGLQYRLHETPPEGYTGPTTLAEFIPLYRAARAANAATNDAPANDANVPPAADANVRRPAPTNVVPTNGTVVRQTNGETFAGTNAATQTANVPANDPALDRLLDAAEKLGMFAEDPSGHRKLTARLRPMLAAGWREDDLHKLVTEDLGGADKRIWLALRHLADAEERRVRTAQHKTAAPKETGPKCDKGLGHELYPADNCQECKIIEREEAEWASGVRGKRGLAKAAQ